ncbi:MAG: glycosyltransferase [Thaumarchaeota archaeon]|nr:glycosyltransferase [Nitrososphaerota archaeon]
MTKRLVADVHTGFLSGLSLTRHGLLNGLFTGFLKYVDLVIIHNETNLSLIPNGTVNKTIVLYDPFFAVMENQALTEDLPRALQGLVKFAVFPASWHPDEPIISLLDAWTRFVPGIKLVVTGHPNLDIMARISKKVGHEIVFTGYLSHEAYLGLVSKSRFLVSASTSEYDAQASSYEALSFSKPIVATETRAIKLTIGNAAAYFDLAKPETLAHAVDNVMNNYYEYEARSRARSTLIEKETRDVIQRYLLP